MANENDEQTEPMTDLSKVEYTEKSITFEPSAGYYHRLKGPSEATLLINRQLLLALEKFEQESGDQSFLNVSAFAAIPEVQSHLKNYIHMQALLGIDQERASINESIRILEEGLETINRYLAAVDARDSAQDQESEQ